METVLSSAMYVQSREESKTRSTRAHEARLSEMAELNRQAEARLSIQQGTLDAAVQVGERILMLYPHGEFKHGLVLESLPKTSA